MTNRLYIALIHLNVHHGKMDVNAQQLIDLNRAAAKSGHKIILNTEMALSGYSFDSREAIMPFTCTLESEPVVELSAIAREYKAFICVGMATRKKNSAILQNSALVIGPEGDPLLTYHKINAETRWACPGDPLQNNIFDTPWGQVGVLICSDTYHGLLVRQTALKGADLILVPSNWPLSGLDPKELWAIRARENGIYIAACNRTGMDWTMNCESAPSGMFSPEGSILTSGTGKESTLFSGSLPLEKGKFAHTRHKTVMAERRVKTYGPVYLDMRYAGFGGSDITGWHNLNPPAPFKVISHTQAPRPCEGTARITQQSILTQVSRRMEERDLPFTLLLFPRVAVLHLGGLVEKLHEMINGTGVCVCFCCYTKEKGHIVVMVTPEREVIQHWISGKGFGPGPEGVSIVDTGPARIGVCLPRDLLHPETGVAHAKLGCDIIVSSMGLLDKDDRMVMAGRCLEKTGIAVSARNCAFVSQPPKGHARWEESLAQAPEQARMTIDPESIRERIFQDRMDFDTLLAFS